VIPPAGVHLRSPGVTPPRIEHLHPHGQEKMHPDKAHPGRFAHGQQGEHSDHDKPGTFAEGKRLG
jgi:hypothetical protein